MKIYKENDEVKFVIGKETIIGKVTTSYVSMRECTNYEVFNKLGIHSTENIQKFCSKHYRYDARSGAWPTCKSGDYEALSRLIHALQELCDKHNGWTLSPESTKELNIGDKVRITGNETDDPHKFKIGEVVIINDFNGSRYNCTNQKENWCVNPDCIEKIEDISNIQEPKVGDWVKCICNTEKYSSDYTVGNKYQITVIHEKQNEYYLIKSEKQSWWHEVPGKCFIPCESDVKTNEQIKVGDYVKCIGHSEEWSQKFEIGEKYEVLSADNKDSSIKVYNGISRLWVPKKDFILCNNESQDDSEWKVGDQYEDFDKTKINIGDKLIYIRSEVDKVGTLKDCTIGKIYTVDLIDSDGDPKIHDDRGDRLGIWGNKKKYFKKIINNQTTTINYVKSNSNNSFELPSSSPAISARQTPRGGIVSSSDLEIWI